MIQESRTPLRALIVEDSEDDALLLVLHLESGGYKVDWQRVETETDLAEALRDSWDIVFSDYSMPDFSGSLALKKVRDTDPDLPFVFVSGTIGESKAVASIKEGAQDYVIKGQFARLLPTVDRELRDVRLRRGRRELEEDRARLAEILEATPDMVAIFDLDGNLSYLNRAGCKILGREDTDNIEGQSLREILPRDLAEQLVSEIIPAVQRYGIWKGETVIQSADGIELPLSHVVLAHKGVDGEVAYISAIARDISERKHYESELRHLASHDSLTGLPNRFFLTDRLQSALHRAQRRSSHVAVMFLGLDNFKRVNDNLGHAAGDELLQQVATRLQSGLRPDDTVARHSGDEFTIIIGDVTQVDNVVVVLHKLRAMFAKPIIVKSHEVYVTFSTGISLYPHDGTTVEDLLRHADTAMSRSKIMGSNQYLYYSPDMNARGHEILALEADLQRALENNEYRLYCQPQMAVQDNKIVGFEGLIRWQHPARGLVPPADFIPLLEKSGLIIDVGEWVLREACSQFRKLQAAGFEQRISVNVSAAQFGDQELLNKIRNVLKEERMPGGKLELEITENIFMQDPLNAAETLSALHQLGVRTAIDDFGTGYSSLAYLKRFPLDVLKIDQTFVADIGNNAGDNAIVEASILLAQKLGLEVVAEGVETKEQLEFLRHTDCNLVQGYYISLPLSATDLMKRLPEMAC